MPSETKKPSTKMGEEYKDVKSRERRSKTRPRQRATRWERPAQGAWSTSTVTQVISTDLKVNYEAELDAVHEAYPDTKVWLLKEGLWLVSKCAILDGISTHAVFVTFIPYFSLLNVRSWGFWDGCIWIGPRHTNFNDGSVCAFQPTDGMWTIGGSIVRLLDIYAVWAVRQLYLHVFGRWPGEHVAFHPYERILEMQSSELCGCGSAGRLYSECCQEHDLKSDIVTNAVNYTLYYSGGLRCPPNDVVKFARKKNNPPEFNELFKN